MILITEFYISDRPNRTEEMIHCVLENIKNKYISKIFILLEGDIVPFNNEKVIIINTSKRYSYTMMMDLANKNYSDDDIVIIANCDIIFDETLEYIHKTDMNKKFIALSRYDYITKELTDIIYSQDAWIFKKGIEYDWRIDFYMGTPHCDSRISRYYYDKGYKVVNPAKLIKTYHYHTDNYRRNFDTIISGPYLGVYASEDMDNSCCILKDKFHIRYMKLKYFDDKEFLLSAETCKVVPKFIENLELEKKSMMQFFNNIDINKGGVILDIGAQVGLYTLYMKYLKNYKCYSFEPYKQTYNILHDNVQLNELTNVILVNKGLSNISEEKVLNVCKDHLGLSTLGSDLIRFRTDQSEQVMIETTTIDEEFYDKGIDVDYIKIDTEGWEYNILKGGLKTIEKCKPDIQLEWNIENMKQCGIHENELKLLLLDMGYIFKEMNGEEKLYKHFNNIYKCHI